MRFVRLELRLIYILSANISFPPYLASPPPDITRNAPIRNTHQYLKQKQGLAYLKSERLPERKLTSGKATSPPPRPPRPVHRRRSALGQPACSVEAWDQRMVGRWQLGEDHHCSSSPWLERKTLRRRGRRGIFR